MRRLFWVFVFAFTIATVLTWMSLWLGIDVKGFFSK